MPTRIGPLETARLLLRPPVQADARRIYDAYGTDPEVTRYFMTVREAACLVIRAGAIGEGGELFILDMGQPIRILDLARELITLSGYRPEHEIQIVFSGLRPGEKLHERLWSDDETTEPTVHPQILAVRGRGPGDCQALHTLVDRLEEAAVRCDRDLVRTLLEETMSGERTGDGVSGSSPGRASPG